MYNKECGPYFLIYRRELKFGNNDKGFIAYWNYYRKSGYLRRKDICNFRNFGRINEILIYVAVPWTHIYEWRFSEKDAYWKIKVWLNIKLACCHRYYQKNCNL